eukprot:scaffold5303_cov392-Prasinococcus_capsulatus_cf.AAC.3
MNSSTELLELYACELGSGPKYGNTIQWSDEGLLAVATGPIITIVVGRRPLIGPEANTASHDSTR